MLFTVNRCPRGTDCFFSCVAVWGKEVYHSSNVGKIWYQHERFMFHTAMVLKSEVFWNVTLRLWVSIPWSFQKLRRCSNSG